MSVLVTIGFVVVVGFGFGLGVVDGVAAAVVDDEANSVSSFSAASVGPKFCTAGAVSISIFFEFDECNEDFSSRLCDWPLFDGISTNTFATKCVLGSGSPDAVSTFISGDAWPTSSVNFRSNVMGLPCSGRPCSNSIELWMITKQ